MNTIRLIHGANGWFAKFGGPHARDIEWDFGTDTLPMGFGAALSLNEVRDFVRNRYPGCTIIAKHGQ